MTTFTTVQFFDATLIAVGIAALGLGLRLLVIRTRSRSTDHEMRQMWDQAMREAPREPYDGDTYAYTPPGGYDWPESNLAQYLEQVSTTAAQPVLTPLVQPVQQPWPGEVTQVWPVPASQVSGPLPVQQEVTVPPQEYDPKADADAFIRKMEAENAVYIARMGMLK